jgi:hypothetical protein
LERGFTAHWLNTKEKAMPQIQRLRAVFALPKAQVQAILERDSERAGVDVEVTVRTVADHEYPHAVGPAQAVMFLIGAVAAEGEAALVKVEQA